VDPDPDSDPVPDPAFFVIDLQDASKKLIFNTIFSAYYFLKVHLHHFSKIKSQKEPQNSRNQGFYYYFCMMIEGSGSGSISLTSGSGSGRPKTMCIRIRNTDWQCYRSSMPIFLIPDPGSCILFWFGTAHQPRKLSRWDRGGGRAGEMAVFFMYVWK
jgi:hypothetical protein